MDLGDLGQWVSTVIIAVVLILTIRKNGKEQKTRDLKAVEEQAKIGKEQAVLEAIREEKLKNIKTVLDHPEYGLAAIKEDVSAIQTNCASVTAGFKARIIALEKTKGR